MNRLEKARKKINQYVNFPDKESRDELNKLLNEFGKEYERNLSMKKFRNRQEGEENA